MKLIELEIHDELPEKIKKHLMDYEEHSAHAITRAFPEVVGVFGEIVPDEGRDPDGGYMTHHWVEIGGYPYDFAKGTLGDYVNWHDKYDVEIGNDDWRYHPIHKRQNGE